MKLLILLFSLNAFAEEVYINNFGITLHNYMPDIVKPHLYHPVDRRGLITYHSSELGVLYKNPEHNLQMYGLYLRDCFNMSAGYVAVGPMYRYGLIDIGGLIGPYLRETPPVNLEFSNVAPLPFFTVGLNIPFYDNLSFSINTATNYFISHGSAGLSVKF